MIKDKIKKSFLVISSPPFGGKHSTIKYSYKNYTLNKYLYQYKSYKISNFFLFVVKLII